jgi:hypothetical protein
MILSFQHGPCNHAHADFKDQERSWLPMELDGMRKRNPSVLLAVIIQWLPSPVGFLLDETI